MFQLRKWYLDCALPDGGVVIVYWARARLGAVTVRYASYLLARGPGIPVQSRFTLRCGPEPVVTGAAARWSCPALGIDGQWEALCGGIERDLLKSDRGDVRWSCLMPRARCAVSIGPERYDGLGYVERLEMTIPPWQLPVRELRWGRWLAEGRSLVWIDWQGPRPLTLIAEDGQEVAGAVSDSSVQLSDGRELRLQDPRTLRRGELGSTVLGRVPGLSRLLPAAIMRTTEHKWLSHGSGLSDGSLAGLRGDSVYELVTFGG